MKIELDDNAREVIIVLIWVIAIIALFVFV